MIIKVKTAVERQGKQGPFKVITDQDNKEYFLFDLSMAGVLREGDVAEIEASAYGAGQRITGAEPAPEGAAPPKTPVAAIQQSLDPKQDSIERQVALKEAVNWGLGKLAHGNGKDITTTQMLDDFEEMVKRMRKVAQ